MTMQFDAKNAALIVVDLQRAFCCEDGSVAIQGRDISMLRDAGLRCLQLADAARDVGIPIFWTRLILQADYSDGGVMMHELLPNLKKVGGLRAGTPDVEFMPGLKVHEGDIVVDKIRNSSFYGTSLDAMLRARNVNSVMVCGLTTSMCVESTVRDASQRDYKTFVVRDAVSDFSEARHTASLEVMEFGFARIFSHNEALSSFQS